MVTAKAPLAMTPADFLGPKSQAKNAKAMPSEEREGDAKDEDRVQSFSLY